MPSQWGGGRLFGESAGSPHENGRNSETKSRTIDLKVPKRSPRRGKKGFSGRTPDFCGKKKYSLITLSLVLATTGQCCQMEKSTLFPNEYQSFSFFGVFFLAKNRFLKRMVPTSFVKYVAKLGTPKRQCFVLLMLLGKLLGGCKSPFLAQKRPENQTFYAAPIRPHFFGLRRT